MASGSDKLWIIDTTLRDGEQSPGLVFTKRDKVRIAVMLAYLGVDELEAGYPAIGDFEIENIKEIVKQNLNLRLTSWSRAKIEDIDKAAKTGTEAIHLSFPVSEILLKSIGKNKEWIFENLELLIGYAKKYFNYVSVGAMDAGRGDKKLLADFIYKAAVSGACRVRIADTIGMYNPIETYKLIRKIKRICGTFPVEFHAHNDLGMATANSVSAVMAGCDAISVTINGIGERAGNAPLEEVIMALKYSNIKNINIDTHKLSKICNEVSNITGIKIPVNKPIIGDNACKHESGIHCRGLIYDRNTFELFHASDIGKSETSFVIGKHSGISSIIKIFNDNGLKIEKDMAKCILEKVKIQSIDTKKAIDIDELICMYKI